MRNPKWTIDEAILGVNTYFQIGDVKKVTDDNPLIIELSSILRSFPIHKITEKTFRNNQGIEMILKNIAALDETARYRLKEPSKVLYNVFKYYENNKGELAKIAIAIMECIPLPFEYYEPLNKKDFMAGDMLYLYHLYIENQSKMAKIMKKDIINRKKSKCMACDKDLRDRYGERSVEITQLHYSENVTNFRNNMSIIPGKFVFLCPDCHILSHLEPGLLLLENLRKTINGGH